MNKAHVDYALRRCCFLTLSFEFKLSEKSKRLFEIIVSGKDHFFAEIYSGSAEELKDKNILLSGVSTESFRKLINEPSCSR